MKSFLTIPLLCLLPALSLSAQSSVRGLVQDSLSQGIPFVSVVLIRSNDSAFVKATISDEKGVYLFSDIRQGSYMIHAAHVGFRPVFSKVMVVDETMRQLTAEPLTLLDDAVLLNTVTVSARKPLLEQKIDRLVINVAASITSSGNTALEVLERAPGIVVDRQNNLIAMNGKSGVFVMLNGKISYMPATALIQLLAGMNSNNIEKIELITTPPANLDAAGNAGYINIVLKENNNQGTNGSWSANLGYGRGLIGGAAVNMNRRKNNFNVYGDLSYSHVTRPFLVNSYTKISNAGQIAETFFDGKRQETTSNSNGRLGIDLQVSRKTITGILLSGYDNYYSQDENNHTSMYFSQAPDTLIYHKNHEVNHWYNYSANLNLQHQFNENNKLQLNLDYIRYGNNQPVNYRNTYHNGQDEWIYDQQYRSGKKTPIAFWVGSADYTRIFSKKISLDAGIKQTFASFRNDISFDRLVQNIWQNDKSLSASYTLKEDYSAAYSSLNISFSEKTQAKIGLRYEHTNSNLGTLTEKNIVDRHYSNLFPSLFVMHRVNKDNAFDVSYSKRITRPTFNDLAPFTYYINANSLLTGNPALQPAISENIRAGYSIGSYSLSLSYSYERNAIAGFQPHIDSVKNKIMFAAVNLNSLTTTSISFSAPFTLAKWWNVQFNVTGVQQYQKAPYQDRVITFSQTNFSINGSQQFSLPGSFSFEISGYYLSPMLAGVFHTRPMGSLDAGIRKKLPGKGGVFTLNAQNILNTNKFRSKADMPQYNLVSHLNLNFSQPSVKLTYLRNFGKENLKQKRERTTGAEDEKGRVR